MPQLQNASFDPQPALADGAAPGDGEASLVAAPEPRAVRVLLVEDDSREADRLRKYLQESEFARFEVRLESRLDEALEAARTHAFDVCLLDLWLPDSGGLDTFATLAREAPDLPCVLMSDAEDDAVALHAVQYGAQDHLVKPEVNGRGLPRSLVFAIERQRTTSHLRALSMQDALTGLYNRRGFFLMAEQNLKAAHRERRAMAFFYADLDGLKEINDSFGHHEGDWALIKAADILRATFRDSDIIARLSGDEFTVLAWVQSPHDIESVKLRLGQHIAAANVQARRFSLLISIGAVFVSPGEAVSVHELLARADASLYLAKKSKPATVLLPPSNA